MEVLFEFCHARRVVFLAVIDIEDFEAGLREVHDVEEDAEIFLVFGDREVDTVPFGLVVVQEGAGTLLEFRGEFRRHFRSTEDVRALAGIDSVGAGGHTHDGTGVRHVQGQPVGMLIELFRLVFCVGHQEGRDEVEVERLRWIETV